MAVAAETAPPTAEDLAYLRDAAARMGQRVEELRADVRQRLVDQRDDERRRLVAAFDSAIAREDKVAAVAREAAMARLELFVQRYPDAPGYPEQAVRLANLYMAREDAAYVVKNDEYVRLLTNPTPDMEEPPPPQRDYGRPIALYESVLARFPDYPRRATVMFNLALCYHRGFTTEQEPPPVVQFNLDKGRDLFLGLLTRYPDAPNAADASFWLGQYYYDLQPRSADASAAGEERRQNLRKATQYYERVLAAGPTARPYRNALYKLGWSYYKLDEFTAGLKWLAQLTELTDAECRAGGPDSDTACSQQNEALELMAATYAEGSQRPGSPGALAMARAHLAQFGDRPWIHDVYVRLASTLWDAADPQTSDVYAFLQEAWPNHPDNPTYQQDIGLIYLGSAVDALGATRAPFPSDPARASEAWRTLADRYFDPDRKKPWVMANKDNPAALKTAENYVELSYADVVGDKYNAAVASGRADLKFEAADEIERLLRFFPLKKDAASFEKARADLLVQAAAYDRAVEAYELIAQNTGSSYRDEALYLLPVIREMALRGKYGGPEAGLASDATGMPLPPEGAVVETVSTSPFGVATTRYLLADDHAAYVAACDRLGAATFDPTHTIVGADGKAVTIASVVNDYLPNCRYRAARVELAHGRLDEARARLEALVARYPTTTEGANAAILYVRSHETEGDFLAAAKAAERFSAMALASAGQLREQTQNAELKLAARAKDRGDRSAAAEAYLAFARKYPKSDKAEQVMLAAGDLFTEAGRFDDATRTYEEFLKTFPRNTKAADVAFVVAANYARALETQRAVDAFEAFARTYPRSPQAPAAVLNATMLRRSLPDAAAAAKAQERYVVAYPDSADAEAIFWSAGDFWGQVSDAQQLDFYGRYLKRYPDKNPDHVIEALYRQARALTAKGDAKKAGALWTQIDAIYQKALDAQTPLAPLSKRRAAEGAIAALRKRVEAFRVIQWTDTGRAADLKANILAIKAKSDEMVVSTDAQPSIVAQVEALRTRYLEAEAYTAATVLLGIAQYQYGDFMNDMPFPGDADGDGEEYSEADLAVEEQIRNRLSLRSEDVEAQRGAGRATLEMAIQFAARVGWSTWASMAQDELARVGAPGYGYDRPEAVAVPTALDVPYGLATAITLPVAPVSGDAPGAEGDTPFATPPPTEPAPPAPGGAP
jgi:TolA-binding protein